MITTATFFHEWYHRADFAGLVKDGEMAIFIIPDNSSIKDVFSTWAIGTYSYSYDLNNSQEVERIGKYTEYKAYSITLLIVIMFIVIEIVVVNRWVWGEEDE